MTDQPEQGSPYVRNATRSRGGVTRVVAHKAGLEAGEDADGQNAEHSAHECRAPLADNAGFQIDAPVAKRGAFLLNLSRNLGLITGASVMGAASRSDRGRAT